MRLLGIIVVLGIAYLNPTRAIAQQRAAVQHQDVASHQDVARPQDERELEPYHKHHDPHHGHKHVYPDRGAIFREVPRGTVVVNYAGLSYRFHDGVWFQPQGSAFIVVAPPIGVVVPTLPGFATPVENGGNDYLYANDTYYRARPDLGGYEVVNDPVETAADAAADAAAAATPPSSAPTADAAPLPAAAGAAVGAAPSASSSAPTAPLQAAGSRGPRVFAYPKNGQSAEQQAADQYECYRFGVAQSGFDPMGSAGAQSAQAAGRQADFDRAQAACFDGRGYTVR